jgi:hypothetical protein
MASKADIAKAWAKARRVFPKLQAKLLKRSGVIGVSLGLAHRRGKVTREPAIRVHFAEKLGHEKLKWNQKLPKTIQGVRIDVIESAFAAHGDLPSAARLRILRNPMFGGVAITRFGVTSYGTVSALVVDKDGSQYVLTAQHVAGGTGNQIVQPVLGSVIGRVQKSKIGPDMDAALVRLTSTRMINAGVSDGVSYTVNSLIARPGSIDESSLPFKVDVIGASSGKTQGVIDSLKTFMDVEYDDGQTVSFVDQIHLVGTGGEISRGGDSGALVLERGTNKVIALLFAGESSGQDFALATPIQSILDEFKVSFV